MAAFVVESPVMIDSESQWYESFAPAVKPKCGGENGS